MEATVLFAALLVVASVAIVACVITGKTLRLADDRDREIRNLDAIIARTAVERDLANREIAVLRARLRQPPLPSLPPPPSWPVEPAYLPIDDETITDHLPILADVRQYLTASEAT